MRIPLIDLDQFDSKALDDACMKWGFFALRGHGIHPQLIKESIGHMRGFFELPAHEKNQIRRSETNCWGYYDSELTKNRKDWKEILDIGEAATSGPLAGAYPQWPDIASFRQTFTELTAALHNTARDVTHLVTKTLGTPVDLDMLFSEHSSFLRLNYYPPCTNPAPADAPTGSNEGEFGIHHHTDAGAVTVLIQDDVPGLQVLHDSAWITVHAPEDCLIINIGDIVQVWSNDRYQAPLHRVLASTSEPRYSIPYFLNPAYDYNYSPLPATLEVDPPHYRPINWGEFRAGRSAGDYADQGHEIQISDFRT